MYRAVLLITAAALCVMSKRSDASPVVEGNGVGPVRIGVAVKGAKAPGTLIIDRLVPDGEDGYIRSLRLRVGAEAVEAEVLNGKVIRVTVRSPALRTARDFGVGTKLADLLREPGWEAGFAEGHLFIWNRRYCGLSFELDFDPHNDPARNPEWSQSSLSSLPASTSIQSILVLGCSK